MTYLFYIVKSTIALTFLVGNVTPIIKVMENNHHSNGIMEN